MDVDSSVPTTLASVKKEGEGDGDVVMAGERSQPELRGGLGFATFVSKAAGLCMSILTSPRFADPASSSVEAAPVESAAPAEVCPASPPNFDALHAAFVKSTRSLKYGLAPTPSTTESRLG